MCYRRIQQINLAPNTDSFDRQILDLVNQERAKVGVDPLKINEQLDRAADIHSQDQANMDRLTHRGSDGSSEDDRVGKSGYLFSLTAENIAPIALDAETVMYGGEGFEGITLEPGWMGSEDHRNNILDSNFEDLGVGYSTSVDGSPYWTLSFGDPADSAI